MNIYCGNNNLDDGLTTGTKRLGSKNECLRRGYGSGYHAPLNPKMGDPYVAVDPRRYYCGDNPVVPAGYDFDGSPSKCIQKGFGVGQVAKWNDVGGDTLIARLRRMWARFREHYLLRLLLTYVLFSIVAVIVWYYRPGFLLTGTSFNRLYTGLFMAGVFVVFYGLVALLLRV
jgi:hypothetical protein